MENFKFISMFHVPLTEFFCTHTGWIGLGYTCLVCTKYTAVHAFSIVLFLSDSLSVDADMVLELPW